ncbi:MAG: YdcF family protein [Alphaproteobacteria bacterium]|nr:YdcF family protein [Alphaproteobacteria bacterium]
MTVLRRPLLRAVLLLALLSLGWGVGLIGFASALPRGVEDATTQTGAIVVLTGGSERLAAGLDLLEKGMAGKLFVSGVYRGVEVRELVQLSRHAPEALECCIALGYSADNTIGNAQETAAWMAQEGFDSLRLVTGNYHMPRALAEFRAVLPKALIIPNPVFPEHVKAEAWWYSPGTFALIASEYTKYLLAQLRIMLEGQS